MHRGSSERGITLIELMIVVAIIGVLAALAAVGYGKWVANAKSAEAGEMIGAIKNGQENYFSQTGKYLRVSKSFAPADLHPPNPGPSKKPWPDVCASCATGMSDGFKKLAIKGDKAVYFGYATVAGTEVDDPDGAGADCKIAGSDVKWVVEAGGKVTKPWYIVGAKADTNGNGVYTTVCSGSFSQRMFVDREGE